MAITILKEASPSIHMGRNASFATAVTNATDTHRKTTILASEQVYAAALVNILIHLQDAVAGIHTKKHIYTVYICSVHGHMPINITTFIPGQDLTDIMFLLLTPVVGD